MLEHLQASINRVLAGTHDEADLREIATATQTGQVLLATGERAIAIGGNANDSVNVSGDHNHVIVINGVEAEEIAQRLQQLPSTQTVSVDELIQQVRPRTSTKILNLFSKIRLLNKRQIEVERLYVDVYVLEKQDFRATIPGLLEGRDAREQFDRFGLGKRGERVQGLAIATSENHPRLMVLGKPGSGKSTFLRHLAAGCAKGEFLGDYIPVLLELRDVDDAAFSLLQWIHEEFELEQKAQTEQILKQGKVLILLDGLDEVPSSLQQKVQSELRKFAKRYDKNRFILSCRTQTTEYIPEQFQAVEVADFNPEQVESFALNWFTAMAETPEQGVKTQKRFIERLRKTPQVAELAITPVLLSLTCWIFDDLKCLPEKRSDLYRDGLDLLLQQWDEGRGISRDSGCDRYQQLTIEERKQLLSYLAFRKFEQSENFVLFEEVEICSYIGEHLQTQVEESRLVLRAISQHHGLLIERAHQIWSFSHLTFQEYFVAKAGIAYFNSAKQESTNSRILQYINKESWREVFHMMSEILDEPDSLLLSIKVFTDSLLANDSKLQKFLTWLDEKSKSIKSSHQLNAIRALYLARALNPEQLVNSSKLDPFKTFRTLAKALDSGISDSSENDLTVDRWMSYLLEEVTLSEGIQGTIWRIQILTDGDLEIDKKLRHRLENIKQTLMFRGNYRILKGLHDIAIEERNLGHRWNFDGIQKRLLREYYIANDILVYCLQSQCNVSAKTHEEIKEMLLLPIAEIEKRKSQSSD